MRSSNMGSSMLNPKDFSSMNAGGVGGPAAAAAAAAAAAKPLRPVTDCDMDEGMLVIPLLLLLLLLGVLLEGGLEVGVLLPDVGPSVFF